MQKVKCLQEQVTLDDDLSIDLKYADNETLIAAAFEHLQLSTSELQNACAKLGMKANAYRYKILSRDPRYLQVDGTTLEKVDRFVFLS